MDDARENLRLINLYREVFSTPSGEDLLNDLEKFCYGRQARFDGEQHEILKAMGRVEVLGRIKFFLHYDGEDYLALINHMETDDE